MRGIGRAFARLPIAAVVLAGAFLLLKSPQGVARAQPVPQDIPATGDGPVRLPAPLPGEQAARLRRAFALQEAGDMAGAARVAAWLDTATPLGRAMYGHLLADRYLNPATRPSADALRDWLLRWPDLPDASALYRLLLARLPEGETPPPPPPRAADPPPDQDDADMGRDLPRHNPELDRDVHESARAQGAPGVLRLLARTRGLSADYAAVLQGEAARILFTLNRDSDAIVLGGAVAGRSAPAALAAGLAAWRTGETEAAGALFAAGADAPIGTGEQRAACAFWAARAAVTEGEGERAQSWLRRAAQQPRSFYGLLARRRLGLRRPAGGAVLTGEEVGALQSVPAGRRAFALLQLGQRARAAAELRPLLASGGAIAAAARRLADATGIAEAPAALKLPPLHPAGGFTVDPAMVYGIARTESNFDPAMISSAGARGILQLMPETARDMLGRPLAGHAELHDPAFNLDLGQRYIVFLAGQDPVNGDLIRLIASYNAGLGSFAHWGPLVRDQGDPLLFIEAIPIDETRAFIPRVLTYTWIYAARMGHVPASLDALAADRWPRYRPAP